MSNELNAAVFKIIDALSYRLLAARVQKRDEDGDGIFALVQAIEAEFPEEYLYWHTAWMRDPRHKALEVCGLVGSGGPACSVCERCKAEILLAEADARERVLRDKMKQSQRKDEERSDERSQQSATEA